MTTAHWVTVVLTLAGIIANASWILVGRYLKTLDELRHALNGADGAVARLHGRIDKLGDTYQTRKETEMQFEHLRAFMDHWKDDSQRRHEEHLRAFHEIKEQQKQGEDSVRQDVRELRKRLEELTVKERPT